jgi:hypothetical protein
VNENVEILGALPQDAFIEQALQPVAYDAPAAD